MPPDEAAGPDPAAIRAQVRALLELGRGSDALEAAQRALIADPEDPETELLVASCHAALDDPQAAIRHAGRASALDPASALPHVLRSRILISIGHRDEAERAARQAVELAPEQAVTHSTLGVVLTSAGRRPDDAWDATLTAVQLSPDDLDVRLDASRVALALGHWQAAEEHAQAALSLRPDDGDALDLLGAALSHQRPDDAFGHFAGAARPHRLDAAPELTALTAGQIAGTDGLDVRRIWLVLLASLGGVWTLALVPRSMVIPLVALMAIAVVVASWRRSRRERYEALSEEERRLVDQARVEPSPVLVATLWTVFGVAAFIGVLYLLQIVVPPTGGATATSAQSAVVVTLALVVMAACWWRLRQLRIPSGG